eukprot:1157305-Pelagomonas_calceolata.AAC.23
MADMANTKNNHHRHPDVAAIAPQLWTKKGKVLEGRDDDVESSGVSPGEPQCKVSICCKMT